MWTSTGPEMRDEKSDALQLSIVRSFTSGAGTVDATLYGDFDFLAAEVNAKWCAHGTSEADEGRVAGGSEWEQSETQTERERINRMYVFMM